MRKYIFGSAMAAMIAGATAAHAAPVADARAASPVAGSEEMAGGSALWLGLLGAAVLAVAIIGINDDGPDDDEFPVSP